MRGTYLGGRKTLLQKGAVWYGDGWWANWCESWDMMKCIVIWIQYKVCEKRGVNYLLERGKNR